MTEPTREFSLHPAHALSAPGNRAPAQVPRCWLQAVLLTWMCGVAGTIALGQEDASPATADPNKTAVSSTAADPQEPAVPKVVSVSCKNEKHPDQAGIGDLIVVEVENLDALLEKSPIKLYLNGNTAPLDDPQVNLKKQELEFRLVAAKTNEGKAFWDRLLLPVDWMRKVEVGVGPAEGVIPLAEGGKNELTLVIVPVLRLTIWAVLFLFLVLLVCFLGKFTKLLRDGGSLAEDEPSTAGAPATGGVRQQGRVKKWNRYSLGRTQMAFWFVLIVGAFGFIWLVTGQVDTLTASVVALAGISAGTALGAVTVDTAKETAASQQLGDTRVQEESLTRSVEALKTTTRDIQAADPATARQMGGEEAKLAAVKEQVTSLKKQVTVRPGKHFVVDILSDANGVSLHRLQIFVWTIVLGFVFVRDVYSGLSMPEFSGTLLALMGVSSGTYIGFKFPEQKQ